MSDGKQIDWKTILSKIKVISISVCCSLVVCGACFFGGYKYSEYRINKEGTSADSKLRVDLDNPKSALDAENVDLTAANNRIAELESAIDRAVQRADPKHKPTDRAQFTSVDNGDSVEQLTSAF